MKTRNPTPTHPPTHPPTFRTSPPVLLGTLTIIALLLGMASARAQPYDPSVDEYCADRLADATDGPKWEYLSAACDLYQASYADFLEYMPEGGELIITVIDMPWSPYPGNEERHIFDAALSEDDFRRHVQPLLRTMVLYADGFEYWHLTRPEPIHCDDSGRCAQNTGDAEVSLRFATQNGTPRLVGIHAAFYPFEEEGC